MFIEKNFNNNQEKKERQRENTGEFRKALETGNLNKSS